VKKLKNWDLKGKIYKILKIYLLMFGLKEFLE